MSAGPCLSGNSHQSEYSSAYCRHRRFKNWRCANKCSSLPLDIFFFLYIYVQSSKLMYMRNDCRPTNSYPTSSIYHFSNHYLMLFDESFMTQLFFWKMHWLLLLNESLMKKIGHLGLYFNIQIDEFGKAWVTGKFYKWRLKNRNVLWKKII